MPIARDTHTVTVETTGSPKTWSHTCTGSNLILFVGLRNKSATDDITAVTYNGVALTRITSVVNTSAYTYLYYLLSPATGANTVSVSYTNTTNGLTGMSVSYTGVKQSSQPDASNSSTANAISISTSLTSIADQCWIITVTGNNQQNPTSTTGFTQLDNAGGASDGDTGPVSPGLNTLTWNYAGTANAGMIVASFPPTPTGAYMTPNTSFWGAN